VKATPMEGKKRKTFQYRHASPIIDLAYYLNEKYGFFEADMDEQRVGEAFSERVPMYMEWFFEELLSREFNMQPVKIARPDLEVDVALREHMRVKVVAEVKWKSVVDGRELARVEDKLSAFKDARRILIVPSRDALKREPEGVEVWDWKLIWGKVEEAAST